MSMYHEKNPLGKSHHRHYPLPADVRVIIWVFLIKSIILFFYFLNDAFELFIDTSSIQNQMVGFSFFFGIFFIFVLSQSLLAARQWARFLFSVVLLGEFILSLYAASSFPFVYFVSIFLLWALFVLILRRDVHNAFTQNFH